MKKRGKARTWAIGLFIAGPAITLACLVPLLTIRFDALDPTQYLLYFAAILAFPLCWVAAFVIWGVDVVVSVLRERRQAVDSLISGSSFTP